MSTIYSDSNWVDSAILAPALEPNVLKVDEEDASISLEDLLSEIKRLTEQDFAVKGVRYHTVLQGVYQRLCDYDVMLRHARKKAERVNAGSSMVALASSGDCTLTTPSDNSRASWMSHSPSKQLLSSTTFMNATNGGSPSVTPKNRRSQMLVPSPISNLKTSASKQSSMGLVMFDDPEIQQIARLEEKVADLERQLAQSRRAHHGLLQDHIMSLKASAPSTTLVAQSAVVTQNPVIQAILSSVTNISPASPAPVPSITFNYANQVSEPRTRTLSGHSRIAAQQARLSESMTDSQLSLQDALMQAQDQQAQQLNRLKGNASPSDSEKQMAIDSQSMVNEAVTRLLRAETELGLLKLVMAQNQDEISGLEDEVFQKQNELHHHRRILESMIESNRLGYVAQIQEDRTEIRTLATTLAKEKKEGATKIATLEKEVQDLKIALVSKTKDSMTAETKIQIEELEAQVVHWKSQVLELAEEMALLKNRVIEAEQESMKDKDSLKEISARLQRTLDHGVEEALDMIDHMEKEHKTKSGVLKSNLVKSQKVTIRLQNEVSAMALRVVRIQTLNEKLEDNSEKDQREIAKLGQEVAELKESLEKLQSGHTPPTNIAHGAVTQPVANEEEALVLKQKITALEIQIEEVSASLRLKELELEQAVEQTEKAIMQLEESEVKLERELEIQRLAHVEKMHQFDLEKKAQAQRERAGQAASVTLFQNMVTRLQQELNDTEEKLRDTTLCWGQTKEQLMKCDASYRKRRKELADTTKALHEVNETVAHLSDAIGLLENEKQSNLVLVQTLAERDQILAEMEYRIKQLEEGVEGQERAA
ncbi:hypothetical protein BG004_007234 [Podila humilis]|nr:hypothetical protein BG004_007234 [Podila humilis]